MSHINVPLVHSTIYHLTSDEGGNNWRKLLAYGKTLHDDIKRKFLWFWPTEDELQLVQQLLQRHGIECVLSIGCGSGLLEWLLRESGKGSRRECVHNNNNSLYIDELQLDTYNDSLIEHATGNCISDLEVYGLEIDRNWWRSAYAIKQFIDLNFVDNGTDDKDENTPAPQQFDAQRMRACCHTTNWQFALLFCYFNNRSAFLHYLRMYAGDVLLIIGPQPAVGIHTDPEPLQPNIPTADTCGTWQLCETLHFGAENVLALYKRAQNVE